MKKIHALAGMLPALCWAALSCTAPTPKAHLQTRIDSVSYAYGYAQSKGLDAYLQQNGIDSTRLDEFIEGMKAGFSMAANKDNAYARGMTIGLNVGNQKVIDDINAQVFMGDSTQSFDRENMLAGFLAAVANDHTYFDMESASDCADRLMGALHDEQVEQRYADWRAQNVQFMKDNKAREGIQVLPSGVQYKVLKAGNGPLPTDKARVKVAYKGTLIDGTVFEDCTDKPRMLQMRSTVPGFKNALSHMPAGSKWQLFVPHELAYENRVHGKIKPYSTLIFEAEVLEVIPEKK